MSRVAPSVVQRLLTDARATIATRGWCQGAPAHRADGSPLLDVRHPGAASFSTIGAIELAARGAGLGILDREVIVAIEKVRDVVSVKAAPNAHHAVADWNDDPLRTRAEVVAAFTKALATNATRAPRAAATGT